MSSGQQNLVNEIGDFLLSETELSYIGFRPFGTESPIESLLISAVIWGGKLGVTWLDVQLSEGPNEDYELKFETQSQIGDFRVDFLFTVVSICGVMNKLVVECDGHDFHERTKEQAARDRARDRFLQQKGYIVFRFTGSEIYRSPLKCARQIFEWAERAYFKKKGE